MADVKAVGQEILDAALAMVEPLVKAQIQAHSDEIVDKAADAIAKAIPGTLDDAIIKAIAASAKPAIKQALLDLADKISAKV